MNNITYPAIFSPAPHSGYTVTFPDLLGCVSEGNSLDESLHMAEEALGLYLDTLIEDGQTLPKPRELSNISLDAGDCVRLITYRHTA